MRLEHAFEVTSPPSEAWALLNDVPRVIPCMPGAELNEAVDEKHWKATMHVTLGPISLQFATNIERSESDEAAMRAVLSIDAREIKGRGGARAQIESSLRPIEEGTRVTIVTDLALQGRVAQYGRGIVGDVSNQLVSRFAECLAEQLIRASPANGPSPPPMPRAPQPVNGLRLTLRALWRRLVTR